MRAAPPIALQGLADPAWIGAWAGLSATVLVGLLTWCVAWWSADDWVTRGLRLAAWCGAAMTCFVVLRNAAHPQCWQLQWDGQCWWLAQGSPDAALSEAAPGAVVAAIDANSMLLLRFQTTDAHPRSSTWLFLRRSRHAAAWHTLRCAVYSPRRLPEAGTDSAHVEPF